MKLAFKGKEPKHQVVQNARHLYLKWRKKHSAINPKSIINSLIFGDNLLGMAVLLNSGFKHRIDFIYLDPPFATNRDFHSDLSKRTATISYSPHDVLAYHDKLTGDAYLAFMWKRLILAVMLLSPRGSIYVHIDTQLGAYFKVMMDEILNPRNFRNEIARIKCNPKNFRQRNYGNNHDLIYFYTKGSKNIWNDVRIPLDKASIERQYHQHDQRGAFTTIPLHAPGETANGATGEKWHGINPPRGRHWRTSPKTLTKWNREHLIYWSRNGNPRLKKYAKDSKGRRIQDTMLSFKDPQSPEYPTQKNLKLLELLIKESSSPKSIVLDPFSGGGTTLKASQILHRQFIGIDSSREALKATIHRLTYVKIKVL